MLTTDEFNFIQQSLFCYCSHLTNIEIAYPGQISFFYKEKRIRALAELMDKLRGLTE